MTIPLRNRRRSYDEPGHAHFLTYSCWHRWPLLSKDRSRLWVLSALDHVRRSLDISLLAYVVMPEHVHALVLPRRKDYQMRRILAALKAPVSRQAKRYLVETGATDWIDNLTVRHGTRETFRFWQPGGGFDANLWKTKTIQQVIDYIHANPVRRGLVERPIDWPWSSARIHAGLDSGPIAIDPVGIE